MCLPQFDRPSLCQTLDNRIFVQPELNSMQNNHLDPILQSSAEEITAELLGVDVTRRTGREVNLADWHGSKLGLNIDGSQYEIGILSKAGCATQITNMMLGMEDESISGEEIVDALGEMTNMIAGRLKDKICSDGGAVQLSTPELLNEENLPEQLLEFYNEAFGFSVFISSVPAKEAAAL